MTASSAMVRTLLREASIVLLDFDGPLCDVFAGLPAPVVADRLSTLCGTNERISDDPLEVLRYAAATLDEAQIRTVEDALIAAEVEAITVSTAEPAGLELVHALTNAGRRVGVVSNNSVAAVNKWRWVRLFWRELLIRWFGAACWVMGWALLRRVRVDQDRNLETRKSPDGSVRSGGVGSGFAQAQAQFASMVAMLAGPAAAGWSHTQVEEYLLGQGRELRRLLMQEHCDGRAAAERRVEQVVGADQVARRSAERGHRRSLLTVFGPVSVERIAYRGPGVANLCPADAVLNLPAEKHSHGVRRVAAVEAVRGSYEDAHDAVTRSCGISVGKRQLELLAQRAAVDVDAFYAQRRPEPRPETELLVLSVDGKGIVMRPEALRDNTKRNAARKAAAGGNKLTTRLTGGEKLGRKRMAEVGAVYDAVPAPRQPSDVITVPGTEPPADPPTDGPVARDKWLTASIAATATQVITEVFTEADRRDPSHTRTWVMLVDGARYQLDAITADINRRGIQVHLIVDFIHVLEYLWKAAWCLHPKADLAAETWVADHALQILHGNATTVATTIADQATQAGLTSQQRKNLDRCVDYLTSKADYLRYDHALAQGWPIATGVIEGACRHLVKDRMDITGARWGLPAAEAILKLRALTSNGDFNTYWTYHLTQEHQRIHQTRYTHHNTPQAA